MRYGGSIDNADMMEHFKVDIARRGSGLHTFRTFFHVNYELKTKLFVYRDFVRHLS